MVCWLTRLVVVFCCFLNYSFCDCFYIFDVGQGNCQLAIYEDEKIGVLYDCGTSSAQEHVKFTALKGENYSLIFKKKNIASSDDKLMEEIDLKELMDDEVNITEIELKKSEEQILPKQASTTQNEKKPLPSIKEILNTYELSHLFIILSHPDKDHINLINTNTIPDEIPITVLCEGDWFGHKTNEVKAVFRFLKNRDFLGTCYIFPFYWEGLQGINEKVSYKNLLDTFRQDDNDFTKTLELCNGKTIIPKTQCLSLKDYIKKVVTNPNDVPDLDSFKQVKIAHINFPFDDVNSQSAIVEIKMPKLGMQFFLTGDASEETFARIIESDKEFFKKEERLTSLVMLPHHGSIENKSIWLFRLFQPDIIGISAGNGGQYAHPSKELIH